MNLWTKSLSDGVEVVAFEGYEIELSELRRRPDFFVNHVAEKSWADPMIVGDLRAWACRVEEQAGASHGF
jgi:hypothetical protein